MLSHLCGRGSTRPSLRAVGLPRSSFHGEDQPNHPCRVGRVIFTGEPWVVYNILQHRTHLQHWQFTALVRD